MPRSEDRLVKTVLLLRHAKSSWDQPHLDDFSRPLAPRGRKAAPRIGRYLAEEALIPDRVLCSAARRAVETWELVADSLGGKPLVEILREIYHASLHDLLDLIHHLPDNEATVLLVGHNPTFESLALDLTGSGNEEAFRTMEIKYPTAGLAILEFPAGKWEEVGRARGVLRDFIRPKDLK